MRARHAPHHANRFQHTLITRLHCLPTVNPVGETTRGHIGRRKRHFQVVEFLEVCTRFWDDFGLVTVALTEDESVFEVASGSKVIVMRRNDPRLPPTAANWSDGLGIRETDLGVDTPQALEALVDGLSRDREVQRDTDGTAHFRQMTACRSGCGSGRKDRSFRSRTA